MGASLLAFGRMILVLGLIIGMLLVLAHFARKRQLGGGLGRGKKPTGQIEVLSRRALGRHVSLLVVRVADQTLLVGQSSQQMTLLAELDGEEWVRTEPVAKNANLNDRLLAPRMALGTGENSSPWAWDACVNRLREMTVRR